MLTPPSFKGVLFDLDGTLADTAPDLGAAANRIRIEEGLPALELEAFRPYASHGARGLLGVALSIKPEHPQFESYRLKFLDYYEASICQSTHWFAGVPEMILDLEKRGIAWGIVTNKHTRFTAPLVAQLKPLLNAGCVISGDTTARAKPHPEPLIEGARRLGIPPAQCWYVGDALRDIQAARAAGMYSIAASYGYVGGESAPETWGANYLCDSLSGLSQYLAKHASA
ncbi:MAG: HAD-IA family hydrolase [Pseudomonadota bacterium]